VSESWVGRKVRFKNWPECMYWYIEKEDSGNYIGTVFAHNKVQETEFNITKRFTHKRYFLIDTKVKDTRLARKMYPDFKETEDGYLLIMR